MNSTIASHVGTPVPTFLCRKEPPAHSPTLFGFWLYLMSDCFVFGALFACHGVLGTSAAGGPRAVDVLDLRALAVNTALLLVSSVTFGLAILEMTRRRKGAMLAWLAVSGLLAIGFVAMEIHEFIVMIAEGAGPQRSAFLSSFFTLVSTHGLHVSFGILWLIILMIQLYRLGLTEANIRRLHCLGMFWHFLDLVWVGVFSFVYLVGVLQ